MGNIYVYVGASGWCRRTMAIEKTNWSGGFKNSNGQNTYPYKVKSADRQTIHETREANVHNGEANDRRNYE